jgi:hypothetical protein
VVDSTRTNDLMGETRAREVDAGSPGLGYAFLVLRAAENHAKHIPEEFRGLSLK